MENSERANRARAILNDAVFKDAIAEIRERHLAAFENSAPEDSAVRETAHQMLRALTQLQSELQSAIDNEAIQKGRHRAND